MAESDTAEHKATWKERETAKALERLASARANLAALEDQTGGVVNRLAHADPADLDRLDELDAERRKLQPKANSRFGGAAARDRLDEIALQSHLILERIGFATYDDVVHERSKAAAPVPEVDPVILEFARREVRDAEAAFLDIVSFELPPVEVEAEVETDGDGADVVDLRMRPPA